MTAILTAAQAATQVQTRRPLIDAACMSGALRAADLTPDSTRRSWRIVEDDLIQWVRDGCPVLPKSKAA